MKRLAKTTILTFMALTLVSQSAAQDRKATKDYGTELAGKSSPQGMTRDQADAILNELRQIRHLLESHEVLPARVLPEPAPQEKVQLTIRQGWHVLGRPDAPVTLVEFGDFQCGFCKRFHSDTYGKLKRNYIDTGKVQFVSRDLPLEFHSFAMKAAEAARCAADQGRYWEMRDALYAVARPLSDETINEAAQNLSLDTQSLSTCLASHKYKVDIQRDASEASELQISGTPTFVLAKTAKDKLEGTVILGAQPLATFQSAIDTLLKD